MFIITACILILLGLASLIFNVSHLPGLAGKDISFYDNLEMGHNIGIIQLTVGIIILIYGIRRNRKLGISEFLEYSKCPKCKKAYDDSKLRNHMCPDCNIKTINMDTYYEKEDK